MRITKTTDEKGTGAGTISSRLNQIRAPAFSHAGKTIDLCLKHRLASPRFLGDLPTTVHGVKGSVVIADENRLGSDLQVSEGRGAVGVCGIKVCRIHGWKTAGTDGRFN